MSSFASPAGLLRDLRPGHLDPPDRRACPARGQLEPHDELELLQRRNLRGEALERLLDQGACVGGCHDSRSYGAAGGLLRQGAGGGVGATTTEEEQMKLKRPSPAMTVAVVALVMSMTGGAIAAVNFAENAGAVDGYSAVKA